MGVAHAIPQTPTREFNKNIKGVSRSPFLKNESTSGGAFLPMACIMVTTIIENACIGQIIHKTLRKYCPYSMVLVSSMKNLETGAAQKNKNKVPD